MRNKTVELVNLWHEFEQKHPEAELKDFFRHQLAQKPAGKEFIEKKPFEMPVHDAMAAVVGRLYKFSLHYSRKALRDSDLSGVDDFVNLIVLKKLGKPRKGDLILETVSETSSGSEVIRRLIKKRFVVESVDKEDKRVRRIQITEKGELALQKAFPKMQRLARMLFSKMDESELKSLLKVLKPLESHHTAVYSRNRQEDLDTIEKELLL